MSLNSYEPPPKPSAQPACWDLVMRREEFRDLAPDIKNLLTSEIIERDKQGEQKYGVRLRPCDGRNTLHDIYQEQLDALVYCMKYYVEECFRRLEGECEATSEALEMYLRAFNTVVLTRMHILRVEGV